ncbi:type II toxin-antitoxin system RelE/ParE family toxin [Brevundimonas sp. TWP2-3-4b1]|uniref:type II toxin-antitoxin system RelE/ParE family toxin n=1 Tax=Brevundimonas sp. TWP2-3-4b1 TaxID=2804580 RepID=UPI003CF14B6D
MRPVGLTDPALADIDDIIESSVRDFGISAALRYEGLIDAALAAIAADDNDVGIRRSTETHGVCWYHLRSAKALVPPGEQVGNPRHILLFRAHGDAIIVFRVLHDAMDLSAHLR